jgi:two-component system response regulator
MEQAAELLLVEDNPSDVELTLHVFKKHNFANRIKVVRDGAEALDYIFGGQTGGASSSVDRPKLILLDLKMPKVNGLEVLGRLKSDPTTKRIPVVVLTSSREERDLSICYELGVNSYIVKPVDFVQFNESVHRLGLYWLQLNQQPQAGTDAAEA